jgi:hypothetical protein
MLADKAPVTPHFLLHSLTLAFTSLFPISMDLAQFLVLLLSVMATAALLFVTLQKASGSSAKAGLITAGLLLAAPVALLAPLDHHLYLGYIGINVYHNPTITLLKPLALASFLYATASLAGEQRTELRTIALAATVTVAAIVAKPSYTICLLPALVLLCAINRSRGTHCNLRLLTGGFLLPGITLLAAQFSMTYSAGQLPGVYEGQSAIILAPLVVMHFYSSWLGCKLLLSILFPLTLLLFNFRAVLNETGLLLAWVTFLCGAAYTYLAAESGPRLHQGNFTWSGQITLFILFAASASFLWQQQPDQPRRGRNICSALFLLHVISGIIFYAAEFQLSEKYW